MSGQRVTNAEVAAKLAELTTEVRHFRSIVGEDDRSGLRGEVRQLVEIKNKGWGLAAGLLIVAGGIGAALKATFMEWLR